MKTLPLILAAALLALMLNAQTDTPPPAVADSPAASPPAADMPAADVPAATTPPEAVQTNELDEMVINSDSFKCLYNKTNTIFVYFGNVQVKEQEMTLTCDLLTAYVGANKKIDLIEARTNVVLDAVQKGKVLKATCERATYENQVLNAVTNESLLLGGDPVVHYDGSLFQSDPVVINLQTGEVIATNPTTTRILIPRDVKNRDLKNRMKMPLGMPEPQKPEPTP